MHPVVKNQADRHEQMVLAANGAEEKVQGKVLMTKDLHPDGSLGVLCGVQPTYQGPLLAEAETSLTAG